MTATVFTGCDQATYICTLGSFRNWSWMQLAYIELGHTTPCVLEQIRIAMIYSRPPTHDFLSCSCLSFLPGKTFKYKVLSGALLHVRYRSTNESTFEQHRLFSLSMKLPCKKSLRALCGRTQESMTSCSEASRSLATFWHVRNHTGHVVQQCLQDRA